MNGSGNFQGAFLIWGGGQATSLSWGGSFFFRLAMTICLPPVT